MIGSCESGKTHPTLPLLQHLSDSSSSTSSTNKKWREWKSKKERGYFYSSFNSCSSSKGSDKSYCLQRKRWDTHFLQDNHAVSLPKIMCIHSHEQYKHSVLKAGSVSCMISILPSTCILLAHSKMLRAGRGHTPAAPTSAWFRGHLRSRLEWESSPFPISIQLFPWGLFH